MAKESPRTRSGALVGLRVVELAGIGPAQLGCMLLADLGADVVRVDRSADVPARRPEGLSTELLARGRRSIAVDLKAPSGVAVVLDLIADADVLVDPFRPGVCERLGIGPEVALTRNQGLVFARMTGWGQDGPLAPAAGHDLNYIAVAGALAAIGPEGELPQVPLNLVGDFGGGGMLMAFGVMAALWERNRSGRGQVVDVAMVDGVASLMGSVLQLIASGLWREGRGTNWLQGGAPWYGVYRTADGRFLSVGPLEAKFYAQLLERLGLEVADWPQFDTARWPALRTRMEEIFAGRTLAAWTADLEGTDVCFGAGVALDELTTHPHLAARETYVEVDGAVQAAPAPRFDRTPGAIHLPPPWPGEHTSAVLAELGLDAARRESLLRSGAVAEVGGVTGLEFGIILGDVPVAVDPAAHLDNVLRQVEAAQRNGFTYICVGQHFLYESLRWLQPIPLLSRLAGETNADVKLAPTVLIVPFYHPVLLAEELATLDILCGGRLVIGVGTGYRKAEFEFLGVPYAERNARLAESIGLMTRLWNEEIVTFEGAFWQLHEAPTHLHPVQKPRPPVWMGAMKAPGIRRAARLGDAWMIVPEAPFSEVERDMALYDEERVAHGLELPRLPIRREIVVGDSTEDALDRYAARSAERYRAYAERGHPEMVRHDYDAGFRDWALERAILGTPEQCIARLEGLGPRLGPVIVRPSWPGMTTDQVVAYLDDVGDRVVSAFRRKP